MPVGNGRIGAMVFGGTEDERLQINESTLWGGGPHDYTNPEAYSHLDEVRKLIFAGKVDEAEKLSEGMMGNPKLLMPYQPFCDVRLHFPGHESAADYHRELLLDDAIAETTYKVGSANFHREVFVSYPDQVLVMRITSSEAGQLTFNIGMDSPQAGTQVETAAGTLRLTGQIQPRQNPARSWTGSWDQPGMRFAAVLKVLPEGAPFVPQTDTWKFPEQIRSPFYSVTRQALKITGTSVAMLLRWPERIWIARRNKHTSRCEKNTWQIFVHCFRGCSCIWARTAPPRARTSASRILPTTEDPTLLALYYEFGRYLLISSSRPGGQPANLQGIWNEDLHPAWSSKMTTNINLEMNYWQADAGDLWETQEPLWSLIRDLRVTGADTARVDYHSKGWVLHHNTDLWRATTPVDGFWGIWPSGGVWLANQMWDHYEFSRRS